MSSGLWAIVPAAGAGQRLPGDVPKQYRMLNGQRVLDHCLARLLAQPRISAVMLALSADDTHWADCAHAADARVHTCVGGAERADSVLAALKALMALPQPPATDSGVLVHDAARALLPADALARLLSTPPGVDGALLAVPAQDTLKRSQDARTVAQTIDRGCIWMAQTPQYFEFARLHQALERALQQGLAITDEASCMELAGYAPRLVPGDALNFKITTPSDLRLAEALLEQA